MKPEWYVYGVGEPSRNPDSWNVDCTPFDTVTHTCHVGDAYRIFEDGKVRSSLVWDESRLKNSRTSVSWVSPNSWVAGSIYGNICFEFPWSTLVEGRKFFWVEGIQYYNPPAYRILLTSKDVPRGKLQPYDPTRKGGPIYRDTATDTWYRNCHFTGELLVDVDLNLEDCARVNFVDHHETICRRRDCEERGQKRNVAGARLLAILIGNRVRNGRDLFLERETRPKALHSSAEKALVQLITKVMRHPNRQGLIDSKGSVALYLATALFARAGAGGSKGLRAHCGLFENATELRSALVTRAERHFGKGTLDQIEDLE